MNDGLALRCLSIVVASLLASLSLVSCGGGGVNNGGNIPITTSFLRVVNTLTDSPTLVAGLDGAPLTRVSYAQATGLQQLVAGKYALDVQYLDAAGSTVVLIDNEQLDLNVDEQSTIFLVGTLSTKRTKTVVNPVPNIAAGDAEVQVMQAAANAGTVDVYLTNVAAGTDLKLPTLAYEQASGLATVAPGTNYRLRVTAPGSTTALYDSGVFSIVAATRVMFVVVDYFGPRVANGPGAAGFRVVQLSAQNATNFADEDLPRAFRVANMYADLDKIDVYIGQVDATPEFNDVDFASVTALQQQLNADTLKCYVTPANAATVLYTGDVGLSPGDTRTLVVTRSGPKTTDPVTARATVDLTRPISGVGQLQVINAAPTAAGIDMYLIKAGATIVDTGASVLNQPLLTFAGVTAAPGAYDVAFTPVSNKTPLAGPDPLMIADQGIYTVYAVDAAGGGAPYQIILSTN